MEEIQPGNVVVAIAGREIGDFFIVYKKEEDYLFLVNGKSRTILNPKRKKIKHVRKLDKNFEVSNKILKGERVDDSDIRKVIKEISKGE